MLLALLVGDPHLNLAVPRSVRESALGQVPNLTTRGRRAGGGERSSLWFYVSRQTDFRRTLRFCGQPSSLWELGAFGF